MSTNSFIHCNRSERGMSREGHWKAEDYTWDPHSLRVEARSSAAGQQEQPGSARKSHDEGLCFLSACSYTTASARRAGSLQLPKLCLQARQVAISRLLILRKFVALK